MAVSDLPSLSDLLSKLTPPVGLEPPKSLTHFSFEHDQKLLREPYRGGDGVWARPCLRSSYCVGFNPLIAGHYECNGGYALMEYHTPDELEAFERLGERPERPRVCLLCAREFVATEYMKTHLLAGRSVVLNDFCNSPGPGGYNPAYLLPAYTGKETFHNIIGQVAGLYLNTLRWRHGGSAPAPPADGGSSAQGALGGDLGGAAPHWYIDQSGMAHTETPAAPASARVTFRPLYLCPDDPRTWLCTFFQHRHRLKDRDLLFQPAEALRSATVPAPPTTDFLAWPHGCSHTFIHKLLVYRINRLNTLLNECKAAYGPSFSYHMQLFIDAHTPMANLMTEGVKLSAFTLKYPAHEETLPDLMPHVLAAALSKRTGGQFKPTSSKRKRGAKQACKASSALPTQILVDTLTGCMPECTQAAALHTAMLRAVEEPSLRRVFFDLVQCFVLGNYRQSRSTTPYHVRRKFLAEFTVADFPAFMAALPPDEHITLYALRCYLGAALPRCPPLESLVALVSPMMQQLPRMLTTAAMVRQAGSAEWRMSFEEATLTKLKNDHVRVVKRHLMPRREPDHRKAVMAALHKALRSKCPSHQLVCGVAYDTSRFQNFLRMLKDYVETQRLDYLDMLSDFAVHNWLAAFEEGRSPLQELEPNASCALYDFARAAAVVEHLTVVPLPRKVLDQQRNAVAKRLGCDPNDWEHICRISRLLVCPVCGVRNYVMSSADRESTKVPPAARTAGYHKLELDPFTGVHHCKGTKHKTHCSYKLQHVDLLGDPAGAQPGGGGIYVDTSTGLMISPCCGYLCTTASVRCSGGRFDCPFCKSTKFEEQLGEGDSSKCCICQSKIRGKNNQAAQSLLARDSGGTIRRYGLCRRHNRKWFKPPFGFLSISFIREHSGHKTAEGLTLDAK